MGFMNVVKKSKNSEPVVTAKKQTVSAQAKTTNKRAAKQDTTKIVVKCDCGFSNALFIRGQGIPGLSWDRGVPLKCTKADEWVWETTKPFKNAEFKILLNDKEYESGENHACNCGKSCRIKPAFKQN